MVGVPRSVALCIVQLSCQWLYCPDIRQVLRDVGLGGGRNLWDDDAELGH